MSQTCSQIIHAVCGYPSDERCGEARGNCYVCGGVVSRGISVREWMLDSYTDQNRVAVPSAEFVCEGCCFVMARCSPVPGRPPKEGKKFGGNFRNYSHCWEGGEYFNASKGEKPAIRAFLERRHRSAWFAAIADSGQKHVVPYTPINPPGQRGVVLFDEALVTVGDLGLITALCHLLTDGATKDELSRSDYRPATWQRLGAHRIREFESTYGSSRGHWFSLALWLAQRDEEEVADRLEREKEAKRQEREEKRGREKQARATGNPARRVRGDDKGRVRAVSKGPCVDVVLGPDPKSDPKRSANVLNSIGVRDEHQPKDEPRRAVQLGLFGGD